MMLPKPSRFLAQVAVMASVTLGGQSLAADVLYPDGTPTAAIEAARRLRGDVGYFDPLGRIVVGQFDGEQRTALLRALESEHKFVVLTALEMLSLGVRDGVAGATDKMFRAGIQESLVMFERASLGDGGSLDIVALGRAAGDRLMWQLRLASASPGRRQRMIARLIRDRDSPDRLLELALAALVEEDDSAENILRKTLSQPRIASARVTALEVGLKKVAFLTALQNLSSDQKVGHIHSEILTTDASRKDDDARGNDTWWPRRRYLLWVLERCRPIQGERAEEMLRAIASDEALYVGLRVTAQQILFGRGLLEHPFAYAIPPV